MSYTTQMDAARQGIITEQMRTVADKENLSVDTLAQRMAQGVVIIPANRNHPHLDPEGVGLGLRTKINVNLGISKDACDMELEMEKVRHALRLGAEAIMDLSCFGKTRDFRRALIAESRAMIGTVPIYDAVGFYDKNLSDICAYRESSKPAQEDSCTMCGKMCAVRTMKRIKEGKDIRLDD
jgi:phosphomethylpyrimidine synthase